MARRLDSLRRLAKTFAPPPIAWRGAAVGIAAVTAVIVVWLFASFVAPDPWLGAWAGFSAMVGSLLLAGGLVRLLVPALNAIARPLRNTLFWLLPLLVFVMMPAAGRNGAIVLVLVGLLLVALFAGSIAVLAQPWCRRSWRAWTTLAIAVLGIVVGADHLYGPFLGDPKPLNPGLDAEALVARTAVDRTLSIADPSARGSFSVEALTYGPSDDTRHPDFASIDLVSRSVDGSKLIDGWEGVPGDLRTRYWGFDESELPLRGRAWVPVGDGPFPLVLIVHGNHGMEDVSDPGYGYLGELWASRGTIAVSVDENFLNSSIADVATGPDGGLDGENDARGWVLLQHLALWRDWNADPSHRFHGRIDLERLGLVGHSRGGEAVATAAVFNRLDRYPDDATLEFDFDFGLRGVAAIAPVDGQYRPRGRGNPIRDVDYFVIHGSLDGDVSSFMGASVFERASFSGDAFHFKASLYVEDANHGQFNTTWGRSDMGSFFGWSLDTRPILDPEDQRQIARVALTAFLDASLRGDRASLPILRDPRHAAAWLPDDVFLVANYADSSFVSVADFEEDLDVSTGTAEGSRIVADGLSRWSERWIDLKWNALESHVARLAWDDRALDDEAAPASWSIELAAPPTLDPGAHLIFELAALPGSTLPKDWDDEADAEDAEDQDETGGEEDAGSKDGDEADKEDDTADEDDTPEPLDWTIEIVDAAGERARLALSHDAPLHPPIETPVRRSGLFERNDLSEPVLRRFSLPLADFVAENPAFDPATLRGIRFVFDRSKRGSIAVDGIGWSPDG